MSEGGGRNGAGTPLTLLERARANDPEAWRELVELYRPLVLFWCRRGGADGQDAEDIAQLVFAAVAADLAGFRRDRPGDTFRGWLKGIARRRLLQHFRRTAAETRAAGGSDAWEGLQAVPGPLAAEDEAEEAAVSDLFRRALDRVRGEFEERTWQAFWFTVVEGRSPTALADELGVTPAAIRQAKSRVLRRLKQEVGDLPS